MGLFPKRSSLERKRYFVFILIGAIFLIPVFTPLPFFSRLPFFFDDFVSQAFYVLNKKNIDTNALVLISVDDASFRQINQSWPLRRSLYATTLNRLSQEGARVIGFDFVFKGEGIPGDDDELVAALKNAKDKVVLGYFLDKEGNPEYPQNIFHTNALAGFINAFADYDGIIRRVRGYFSKNDFSDFSFAVKLAALYSGVALEHKEASIVLGEKKVPLRKQGVIAVNYLVMPRDVTTVPLADVLNGQYAPGIFKDKIVLIAPTLEIAHDNHFTPLASMPGVFIHINTIFNILQGHVLVPFPFTFLVVLCVLFLVGYIVGSFSFLRGIFLSFGVMLALLWLNIALRFFSFTMPFGSIVIALFGFLIVANFYNYAAYLVLLLKIKQKMVFDPFTNFYYLRYFYERLNMENKNIPRREHYAVLIVLEGFSVFSKENDFLVLKELWHALSVYLFSCSSLWAVYSDEAVVGYSKKRLDTEKTKSALEHIFSAKKIPIKVKIMVIPMKKANIDAQEIAPYCLEYLKKNAQDTVFFTQEAFHTLAKTTLSSPDTLSSLYVDVEERNVALLKLINELKQAQKKVKEAYVQLVSSLVVALESKDPYTKGHSQRVCNYAFMLATKLGLAEDEKERIRDAALLHDLGKIGISDSILHKRGQLTDEEFKAIQGHEILSAKILEPVSDFKDIVPYVLYHHECYDGSGYPYGLAADFIPLGARILAVADVFDALTSGRTYRNALTTAEAVSQLQAMKGKKLDPVLVDSFIEALKEFHLLITS
ncbi:MAG: CHASE2 domain-containing protein [Candidatus Omnitrophota bacterium]